MSTHYCIKFLSTFLTFCSAASLLAQPSAPDLDSPISLSEALKLAIERDPGLERLDVLEDAAAGQVKQASLRPNPVIGTEVEDILGTGSFQGVEGFEVTVGISQVIETAGKRARRTALAERERELIAWDMQERLVRLEADVRQAFVEVLLAQKAVALREEQLALAEESLTETARLVEAARAPEVDRTRAELAVRQQTFALRQAERAWATAREALAAIWGLVPAPEFSVEGDLEVEDPPGLMQLAAKLPGTPALARYTAEEAVREAALELEKARATPDVELRAGARYYNENSGDAAFLVGVQVPWPVFDKNQGNIRTARARLRAVDYERRTQRRQLLQQLAAAHRVLVNTYQEAQALESELRPAAEQALADAQAGYERGQFTILSVLESRRALFEIRESHLDALERYAAAVAQIEALTRPAMLKR